VILRNETDLGQAPLTVTALFVAPSGSGDPGPNLLTSPVPPGGVVIVGMFAEGAYDAVAQVDVGGNITFQDVLVEAEQPTTLVIPGP
jgi:hypothetical protein